MIELTTPIIPAPLTTLEVLSVHHDFRQKQSQIILSVGGREQVTVIARDSVAGGGADSVGLALISESGKAPIIKQDNIRTPGAFTAVAAAKTAKEVESVLLDSGILPSDLSGTVK